MTKENPINFPKFVDQYMDNDGQKFPFVQQSLQIYPLSASFEYIKPPTPLFRADYTFILLFLNGGGVQQIDNEEYELNKNDILFIREGHLNAIKKIESNTSGFFLHIDYKMLNQLLEPEQLNLLTYSPKATLLPNVMGWLISTCHLMQDAEHLGLQQNEVQKDILKGFFKVLGSNWIAKRIITNRENEITFSFKEAIFQNILTERDVSYYAKKLAISKNYLTRCVTKTTGKSPKEHLNELIINQAKLELQNISKDISEIAFNLNFTDPSYFGRLFKKVTGVTPTKYREDFMHGLSEYRQD